MERDPPPKLGPGEKPTPEEMGELARKLLCELAEHDPALAMELQERGITDAQGACNREAPRRRCRPSRADLQIAVVERKTAPTPASSGFADDGIARNGMIPPS